MVSSKGGPTISFVGTGRGESFRLSPDGRFLSMLRKVKEKLQIFVMPLSGGEVWQLTQGEYHDLMTGADYVIQQGYVDPQKMGVAGWSWGGVSAGWVITQTHRFKAASVGAGVSNWIGESGPGFNWDISNWKPWNRTTK